MSLVEAENIVKVYPGGRRAVDGISFKIEPGEAFGLLGPNGAGKSTTVSMLSCLIAPTSGDARIAGCSIVKDPMGVKRALGVVPQEIALYPTLTARENMAFWSEMYEVPPRERKGRIQELLTTVGLEDRQNERIERFSGGMKRRVNIAVGLLGRPKLLILDEPTVGVDPQSRSSILETLKTLNHSGLTILYTSHYMEEVEFLCSRVGIMDLGRLVALGTQEELRLSVGEKDRIRIGIIGALPDGINLRLGDIPGIDGVQIGGLAQRAATIDITCAKGRRTLPKALELLHEEGIKVRTVEVREPNLETVFLELTGKELRD